MSADTIFSPEQIKDIQTTELSTIKDMSINELSNRIEMYQRTSRELYLRMGKASEELHKRLAATNDDELNKLIEKVPAAERELVSRHGFPKPKPLTVKEKVNMRAKSKAKEDPGFAEFLSSLKAPAKK